MKNPLKLSIQQTKLCKKCFKNFKIDDFYEFVNDDSILCPACQNLLVPHFIKFNISGIDGLAIYEYDENIKTLLYQFKGCYDIELAPLFFNRFKHELHFMYRNYIIVPAPSYKEDDEIRGFKHIDKMFENINLPILNIIEKTSPFKQAEHTKKERSWIFKYLKLVGNVDISNKNILIVDDVYTTGSTLKAMIALIRSAHPEKIKILVMSRRLI